MSNTEKTLSVIVGLLCLMGVAFSVLFIIGGGGNDGLAEYPMITRLHVIPGLLYLALAPLQFLSSVRNRFPGYHRWVGRLLATLGLILGAAALFIGLVVPFSGLPEQVVILIFGTLFLYSIVRGVRLARAREFAEHREWMLRAFAIGTSIVTMRLIFIPTLIALDSPSDDVIAYYSIVSFSISFAIHSLFAELWIRITRTRQIQRGARIAVG